MRKYIPFLFFAAAVLIAGTSNTSAQGSRSSVSGAEVTGTFRMNFKGKFSQQSNDIKIMALGRGKLRVAFDLVYPYTLPDGEISVNMGSLDGEATIAADTAIYSSDEFGPCKITIKFVKPGTIKVTQDGTDSDCGFGHNVWASGTYRKVSGKKPKFDE
ncbi:MAG: hypothetical protein K1X36_06510 [Pyrinomonadaceae bacterium]|nr:hypothetical protein [Pyrinomonadaceae bacterium]